MSGDSEEVFFRKVDLTFYLAAGRAARLAREAKRFHAVILEEVEPAVKVIDSHTGGEPTRLVISGGPELGGGPVAGQLERLRSCFDWFRPAVVCEPRGSDAIVGGLLLPPERASSLCGVIFFNNAGYLGMCGHGVIGLGATLRHLDRIGPGVHHVDTPVGAVRMELHVGGEVSVSNVRSYRLLREVRIPVPGAGFVTGDVAWGGNWFFLTHQAPCDLTLSNREQLTGWCWSLRRALAANGIAGANGAEIDHIELFGPPKNPQCHARNFVLCPGGAYDRSPCGTGTSAKVACLAADGKLRDGDVWRQESIVGSVFSATFESTEGGVFPTIRGSAYVTAESSLRLDPRDPFRWGIPA